MKTLSFLSVLVLLSVSFSTAQIKNDVLLVDHPNKDYSYSNCYLSNFVNYNYYEKTGQEKRDPSHAMWLSLEWPGLGQFYNGPTETTKGTIMAVGQGAFLLVAIIGAATPNEGSVGGTHNYGTTISVDVQQPSINPLLYVGLIGMVGNYIWSMIDANNRAQELNAENGFSLQLKLNNDLPQLVGNNTSNAFGMNLLFKIKL